MQWRITSIVLLLVCGFWNTKQLIAAPAVPQSGTPAMSELDLPRQVGGARIPVAAPMCPISGPRGAWDHYQMRDLPRGYCSRNRACTLWTKDSCPGTDTPGPGIKWKCVCDSGTWRCGEQERTKTVCVGP